MYLIRLKVETTNIDPFVAILRSRYTPDYTKESLDTFTFCAEIARLSPLSMMALLVIFERKENTHMIDVICTGGGSGLMGSDRGTEWSKSKYIANLFIDYCNENGIVGTKEIVS